VERIERVIRNFESGKQASLTEATDWLERVYVKEAYGGRILTDFDEQMRRFEVATFSLNRLLNGLVDRNEAGSAFEEVGLDQYTIDKFEAGLEQHGVFIARDIYVAKQAGAMGPNATASNLSFRQKRGPWCPRRKT
jgi:hypothetical protein